MLTSGGDCQALNAAMRGVVKGLAQGGEEPEIYGFLDGYRGLIYRHYHIMPVSEFSGILARGGTILGTSREPFSQIREPDENGLDKVEAMKRNFAELHLDCLVVLGGNGTEKTANLLREEGIPVIFLPKTIDNDIYGTDITFGFQSALNIATNTIDCIRTTAESHNRVFVVEIMGHKVGWLTLHAGIAGGADIILIPEIPYDIEKVVEVVDSRTEREKGFTILAVAEGAISAEHAALSQEEFERYRLDSPYPSVSYEVADLIAKKTGREVRVTVPGHTQRGGSPCAFDRVLCTQLGAAAAQAIEDGDFGNMIAMVNGETKRVPLGEVAGILKRIDPDCSLVRETKKVGIFFGD